MWLTCRFTVQHNARGLALTVLSLATLLCAQPAVRTTCCRTDSVSGTTAVCAVYYLDRFVLFVMFYFVYCAHKFTLVFDRIAGCSYGCAECVNDTLCTKCDEKFKLENGYCVARMWWMWMRSGKGGVRNDEWPVERWMDGVDVLYCLLLLCFVLCLLLLCLLLFVYTCLFVFCVDICLLFCPFVCCYYG